MSTTKIVILSASGVVGAAASFLVGYFTGRSIERKRQQNGAQEPAHADHGQHAHA
jgi:hypothetical protein